MVDKKDKKKEMQGAILYTFGHMRTMASITPWAPFSEYHSYTVEASAAHLLTPRAHTSRSSLPPSRSLSSTRARGHALDSTQEEKERALRRSENKCVDTCASFTSSHKIREDTKLLTPV